MKGSQLNRFGDPYGWVSRWIDKRKRSKRQLEKRKSVFVKGSVIEVIQSWLECDLNISLVTGLSQTKIVFVNNLKIFSGLMFEVLYTERMNCN